MKQAVLYSDLQTVLRWMHEHADKDGLVLATTGTMFKATRAEFRYSELPGNAYAFGKKYVALLAELGCIEIKRIWNGGIVQNDRNEDVPSSTLPLVKVLKDLTEEMWERYQTVLNDPGRQAQLRITELEAELASLRARHHLTD